jgi:hypothetical protein
MTTMMKMITPLASLNPSSIKIENVAEKKALKKRKIQTKIHINLDPIKDLLKGICASIS